MNNQEQNPIDQKHLFTPNIPNTNYIDQNNQIVNLSNLMNNPSTSENPINQIPNQTQFPNSYTERMPNMSMFSNPNVDPNLNAEIGNTTLNPEQNTLLNTSLFEQNLQSDQRSRSRS